MHIIFWAAAVCIIALLGIASVSLIPGVLFITLVAILRVDKTALVLAFFQGLSFDIASGQPLGQTSVLFLLIALFVSLYKRRFRSQSAFFFFFATFLAVFLVGMIKNNFSLDITLDNVLHKARLAFVVAGIVSLVSIIFQKKRYEIWSKV